MAHLWEVDHPYYCSESNWYSNEASMRYESWASFLEDWGELDTDLNHVFRWDWHEANEENSQARLEVFVMLQRKGLFRPIMVYGVRPDDESSIREWLTKHWETTVKLWEPISDPEWAQ